ncbi:MAG: hypothetical protein KDD33_01265 [Bdellovibrionales bacterium]|nr:hypothetical protein [Bdellovibrionales bacterium]
MALSQDNLSTFTPTSQTQMVILGTMASVSARDVDGLNKDPEAFYYHDKRNHFWQILQLVFEPHNPPKKMKFRVEKEQYLSRWGVAMANIIDTIEISEKQKKNPSDAVIFEAFQKGRVRFKTILPKFKRILITTPLFFTCAKDKKITELLQGYFDHNKVALDADKALHFLLTPTRCNPVERSLGWKIRMAKAGVSTPPVCVPSDFI